MFVRRRMSLLLLLAALGALGLAAPSTAAGHGSCESKSDRWIAFRRYDPEALTKTLWVSKVDGSDAQGLTSPTSLSYFPAWSPDRCKIVFDYTDAMGNEQIATVNVDGTGFTQLTHLPGVSEVADYSPDGQHIIFGRYSPDQPTFNISLWVMNADGTNPHPLLKTATTFDDGARYSPDGSQIVFTRFATVDGKEQTALFVAKADGTRVDQITPYQAELGGGNWSADGNWITYGVAPWNGELSKDGVWLVRPNGQNRHILYPNGRLYGFDPDYSPDGTHILFSCVVRADQQFDLCVMNADGSNVHRAVRTPDVFEAQPAWS